MVLLLIILLAAILLIILLFTIALKVKIVFKTYKTDIYMRLLWLHSFLKALVTIEDNQPVLSLYILNMRLFRKNLKRSSSGGNGLDFSQLTDMKDIHVNVNYGFNDPFTTGITCGVLNAASNLINIASINHAPDFVADHDYINLTATAKMNLGATLIKFFKNKA